MAEDVTVRDIINPEANRGGTGQKAWTMAQVELSNGIQTRIFQPISVGDVVESYQSQDKNDPTKSYTNWRKPKRQPIAAVDPEVKDQLNRIEHKLDQHLLGHQKQANQPDAVAPVDDQPVNLSDIPF